MERFCKLNVPLRALTIRQALENLILQKGQPFGIPVMLGDESVFVVDPRRASARLNLMREAAD
jgi:hypothetical protein